jgi:hypothetical protein
VIAKLGHNCCASSLQLSKQNGRKYSKRNKFEKRQQRKKGERKNRGRNGHTFSLGFSLSRAEALGVIYLYEYNNVKNQEITIIYLI